MSECQCFEEKNHRIIVGWKRLFKIKSNHLPTAAQSPHSLAHKHHISMSFKHFQGLHHLPAQHLPLHSSTLSWTDQICPLLPLAAALSVAVPAAAALLDKLPSCLLPALCSSQNTADGPAAKPAHPGPCAGPDPPAVSNQIASQRADVSQSFFQLPGRCCSTIPTPTVRN